MIRPPDLGGLLIVGCAAGLMPSGDAKTPASRSCRTTGPALPTRCSKAHRQLVLPETEGDEAEGFVAWDFR